MPIGFKRVVLPVDFSEDCDQAAQYAAWFDQVSGGTIHLVHVVANPADPLYVPEEVPNWVMVEHAESKAREMLDASARRCLPPGCPHRFHVLSGDPFEKLMEAVESIRADVIVMSSHGRSPVVNLVLDNVAEKLLRQAPCPMFVVRRKSA